MELLEVLEQLRQEIDAFEIKDKEDLSRFKRRFLGKEGVIAQHFKQIRSVPPSLRPQVGKLLNALKQKAEEKVRKFSEEKPFEVPQPRDVFLPGVVESEGGVHILSIVTYRVISFFRLWGFKVAEGPEIEDDWHNFTALNFEEDHPARDMQDTFFLSEDKQWLLRTHTSTVQIRVMERYKPPIRILAPGKVYRNETISARSHCFFHQIEGLVVDEHSSFADLKTLLYSFAQAIFGEEVQVRFRPSYFPFTEISAEMDISCQLCGGKGCAVCKYSGWVEILGCGMVDPAVLENCRIDPQKYQGYAFGLGVERIAQLLYQIPDIRLYAQNYLPFLAQFRFLT